MSTYIIEQFWFGTYCIFFGIFITLLYDLLLTLREVVRHSSFWISAEDFLFWIVTAFGVFLLLYHMNYGELRWVAVLLLFFGMILYKKIFGNLLVIFMSTIIKRTLHLVVRVVSVPLKFVKRLLFKAFRGVKRGCGRTKNGLTRTLKKYKIFVQKHLMMTHKGKKKGIKNESKKIP